MTITAGRRQGKRTAPVKGKIKILMMISSRMRILNLPTIQEIVSRRKVIEASAYGRKEREESLSIHPLLSL